MVTQPNPAITTSTTTPVIGGILSIISGGLTILGVLFLTLVLPYPYHSGGVILVAMLVASLLAVIGGILAIQRKKWLLSLLGVVASIFSVVWLLGVIAIVLVAVSKKEFNNPASL